MMTKPPKMKDSLDERCLEKFNDDWDYRENDSYLTIDILVGERKHKFPKEDLNSLSFAQVTELSAPETISRKRREFYSQGTASQESDYDEDVESRVLLQIDEDKKYSNSDKALVLEIWKDEAQDRWGKDLEDLDKEEKKKLTKPESISKKRRQLCREGFIQPNKGVQEARMENQDRFRKYYREKEQ